MLLAHLAFAFIALSINPADSIEDHQALRTRTLAQCEKLKATYDATQAMQNAYSPPAFRLRWASACVPMVLTENHSGV